MAVSSDDDLHRLLDQAGIEIDPDALDALIDGVNAAPSDTKDTAWCEMVGEDLSDDLIQALVARREARAKTNTPDNSATANRVKRLRAHLTELGVDGFMLPRADEHQGEFLPARAERLAWLTGFTGSAGMAIVLADRAAALTDGRYTLQIRDQVDTDIFEPRHIIEQPATQWITKNLSAGQRLGYDPWLHTPNALERYRKAAESAGGELVALERNPIDAVWHDQPPEPLAPMLPHEMQYAGESFTEKRDQIVEVLRQADQDAVVLTSPESIAWLLNVRGGDVPRTPLALSFMILERDGGMTLYVDPRKLVQRTRRHFGNAVGLADKSEIVDALRALGKRGARVRIDPAGSPARVLEVLEESGGAVVHAEDPVLMPKACKNPVELTGTRTAHLRDAVAFARFLHWFDETAPGGKLDEITAAETLLDFRAAHGAFRDLSFDTISGSGPNGAIVHYRVTPESNRTMQPGELYLVDSGAQYPDGTTDITRTIAVGKPGHEERERFTAVLKGHITLAKAVFPVGTNGSQLDSFARAALWQLGLDFDHGTGHGVGSYLGVHEGPQRISKAPNAVALREGMIISNEPGYYKTGAYGIRCENLVVVEAREIAGGERDMLGFETITLAPFDRNLIEPEMLTPDERTWLNDYHARVRDALLPLLDEATGAWLNAATAPV